MFMIFLIIFDIIIILHNSFPSFGVLFLTLMKAGKDLIMLLVIIFFLLLGFATWANTLNGSKDSQFYSFEKSVLFLFQDVIIINKLLKL